MKELITTEVLADSYLPGSPPSLTVSDGAFTLAFLWFLQLSVIKVAQKKKKIKENATQNTSASSLLRLVSALWDRNNELKVC